MKTASFQKIATLSKRLIVLVSLLCFFNASHVKAQVEATLYPEGFFELYNKYAAFKDSLPFYFNDYTLGGSNANESNIQMETMNARFDVIDLPVLVTEPDDRSFEYFKNALLFIDKPEEIKEEPKPVEIQRPAMPKEEKILMELKSRENKTPEEEQQLKNNEEKMESLARKQKAKQESDAKSQPNEKKAEANQKVANSTNKSEKPKETKSVNKQTAPNKTGNTGAKPAAPDTASLFAQLPPHIKSRIANKSTDEAIKWLYNRQILAGNVVYCEKDTYMPLPTAVYDSEGLEKYNSFVFDFWKKKYKTIWVNSELEAHQKLAANDQGYFNANAKMNMAKAANVSVQFKAYELLKNQLTP